MKTIDDFAALHRADDPLVLFNVWDAGSAAAVAEAGAKAIATGSLSLAGAQGWRGSRVRWRSGTTARPGTSP